MSYSLPNSAKPFTLNIPEQDISEWRQLLQIARLGPQTYENQQTEKNFGVTHKWLSETKDYWLNQYDWRAQERYINSFDNFKMQIEGIDLHFVAHFSEKKDAIPIIFMHGWPGSFLEFLPMLDLIKKQYAKKDLPYHLVVPSLPGYTLSTGLPLEKHWGMVDSARIMNQLMVNLGFNKYIAQGGDVGSFEARIMADKYDECVAVHLNMFSQNSPPSDLSNLTPFEEKAMKKGPEFREFGSGYFVEHATRPSTIGTILSMNPLCYLAWIGEKLMEWTDTTPPLDAMLTHITLWWFTSCYPTSIYPYRELHASGRMQLPKIAKPTGLSQFPLEVVPVLKRAAEQNSNLVFYKEHEHGGHFAAWEQPKELWEDVEEFVGKAWKEPSGSKL